MKPSNIVTAVAAFALAVAGSGIASDLSIPNTFSSGTRAIAAEVNANFAAIEVAVDDNDRRATENWLADGIAAAPSPNSTVSLSSTDNIVRTVSIAPPFDGTAVAQFQAWFTCTSAAACVARCSINPGGSTLDTTRFAITSVASGQYQTLSINAPLPTTAGQSLTLNAVCDTFAGTGSLGDPALTVVYSAKDVSTSP